jgi:hypothetical protein
MKPILYVSTARLLACPPADAMAKVYLVTEKSVVIVPLAFKDIALP